MDDDKCLIVSCDGGGIRGVVTTMLLQALGQNFLNRVDFFAGTSTGAIIALGLAGGLGHLAADPLLVAGDVRPLVDEENFLSPIGG